MHPAEIWNLKQQLNKSVQEHYERFQLQVKVVESVGGSFGCDGQLLTNVGFAHNNMAKFSEMKKAAELANQKC